MFTTFPMWNFLCGEGVGLVYSHPPLKHLLDAMTRGTHYETKLTSKKGNTVFENGCCDVLIRMARSWSF